MGAGSAAPLETGGTAGRGQRCERVRGAFPTRGPELAGGVEVFAGLRRTFPGLSSEGSARAWGALGGCRSPSRRGHHTLWSVPRPDLLGSALGIGAISENDLKAKCMEGGAPGGWVERGDHVSIFQVQGQAAPSHLPSVPSKTVWGSSREKGQQGPFSPQFDGGAVSSQRVRGGQLNAGGRYCVGWQCFNCPLLPRCPSTQSERKVAKCRTNFSEGSGCLWPPPGRLCAQAALQWRGQQCRCERGSGRLTRERDGDPGHLSTQRVPSAGPTSGACNAPPLAVSAHLG